MPFMGIASWGDECISSFMITQFFEKPCFFCFWLLFSLEKVGEAPKNDGLYHDFLRLNMADHSHIFGLKASIKTILGRLESTS
jgi:hypothetical protein